MASRVAGLLASHVIGLSTAGCASTWAPGPTLAGPEAARNPTGPAAAPQDAIDMVAVGTSTRTEIAARLGPAIVIPFDSGYEVWVYRWRGPDASSRSATELVLLFGPSGIATKARLRPGYPPAK
jgi:hypothetical protein